VKPLDYLAVAAALLVIVAVTSVAFTALMELFGAAA